MNEIVKTPLPTKYGNFDMYAYESDFQDFPHIVLVSKEWDRISVPAVRIHSECMTGDVFGSARCDCGEQLDFAMQTVVEEGGMVVYLRQEGRGIGLINKMKAYNLQDEGMDTIQANLALGLHQDARDYTILKTIFNDFKISKIRLLTNNPDKIQSIESLGFQVVERIPIEIAATASNYDYLRTKRQHMGHLLNGFID